MSVNIKEYPFAKVSHSNPRESVFSLGSVWDTALSRGCVPRSSAPEALRSHTAVGHFGGIITMKKSDTFAFFYYLCSTER